MAAALTITDNRDGTVTVAVAGSPAPAVNGVTAFRYVGGVAGQVPAAVNSAAGNWTTAFALPKGRYVFILTVNGSVFSMTLGRATDGLDPVVYRLLCSIRDTLKGLFLDGLPAESIRIGWWPTHKPTGADNTKLPRLWVVPLGDDEEKSVVMSRDDIEYKILLMFMGASNNESGKGLDIARLASWRQDAARVFRNQRVEDVPESIMAEVVSDVMADINALEDSKVIVSGLMIKATCRESRGI